ncbi:MAG: polysaccharide deacetylase family protein [Saprospirales bacterium]|nr:polysaccharide deacetylase family protein [Saprospirales bacterium]
MATLLIFSPQTSPRLRYTLEEIFRYRLAIDFRHTTDPSSYLEWTGPKITYSPQPPGDGGIWIPAVPFLFESGANASLPTVIRNGDLPALFPVFEASGSGWSFDLFAMVFFMLSRYEEYLISERDEHGRFPSSSSMAGREGFLETPLVDLWLNRFAEKLQHAYPAIKPASPPFYFLPSFDIDQFQAYKYKPLWKQIGAGIRDLISGRFPSFFRRIAVISGMEKDPFDTVPDILRMHSETGVKPLFFFLLGEPGPHDVNHSYRHPMLRAGIRQLANGYPVGIHPSYRSADRLTLVKEEKERLEGICGHQIRKSRQHFLRLRLPESFRALLEADLAEDYSMGYADAIGFRAGTSVPFRWYDLAGENATGLLVVPFQVMDITLKKYMGLSPEEAKKRMLDLVNVVRRTGGTFCCIWHNSSFDEKGDWRGWTAVYRALLKDIQNPFLL